MFSFEFSQLGSRNFFIRKFWNKLKVKAFYAKPLALFLPLALPLLCFGDETYSKNRFVNKIIIYLVSITSQKAFSVTKTTNTGVILSMRIIVSVNSK